MKLIGFLSQGGKQHILSGKLSAKQLGINSDYPELREYFKTEQACYDAKWGYLEHQVPDFMHDETTWEIRHVKDERVDLSSSNWHLVKRGSTLQAAIGELIELKDSARLLCDAPDDNVKELAGSLNWKLAHRTYLRILDPQMWTSAIASNRKLRDECEENRITVIEETDIPWVFWNCSTGGYFDDSYGVRPGSCDFAENVLFRWEDAVDVETLERWRNGIVREKRITELADLLEYGRKAAKELGTHDYREAHKRVSLLAHGISRSSNDLSKYDKCRLADVYLACNGKPL